MRFKRKLSQFFLSIFGVLIALSFPFVYIYTKMAADNLNVIPNINAEFTIYVGIAVILGILITAYFKLFKEIWDRKLQAIATVKEFETVPDKAPFWTRVLRSSEYTLPIIALYLFFRGVTTIAPTFAEIQSILGFANIGLGVMFIVFLIRDLIDNSYRNRIRVEGLEKDELKKEKTYLKRLKKGIDKDTGEVSKKNKKILEIKEKIKEIEEQNI